MLKSFLGPELPEVEELENIIIEDGEQVDFRVKSDEKIPVKEDYVEISFEADENLTKSAEDIFNEYDFLLMEDKNSTFANYVVPFSQRKIVCGELVMKFLKENWFLPSDTLEKAIMCDQDDIFQCYVPFYFFQITTDTTYESKVLITNEDGSRIWEDECGSYSNIYDELGVCATCSISNSLIDKLISVPQSFSFQKKKILPQNLKPYKISDYSKENILDVDITSEEAWNKKFGDSYIFEQEKIKTKERIKDKFNVADSYIQPFICNTEITKRKNFIVLLPIFSGHFTYSKTDYPVLISGNQPIVVGERPMGLGTNLSFISSTVDSITNLVSNSF